MGYARKDGELASEAVMKYLETQSPLPDIDSITDKFTRRLMETHAFVVTKPSLEKLENIEKGKAVESGVEDFKFATNEEMLRVMGF